MIVQLESYLLSINCLEGFIEEFHFKNNTAAQLRFAKLHLKKTTGLQEQCAFYRRDRSADVWLQFRVPSLTKTKHSTSAQRPHTHCQHGGGGVMSWVCLKLSKYVR